MNELCGGNGCILLILSAECSMDRAVSWVSKCKDFNGIKFHCFASRIAKSGWLLGRASL